MHAIFLNLRRDRRGSAAVEFALVAPIMLLLYMGMAEVTQGLLADRRANQVTSAVGDLVAQSSALTSADVNNIFDISATLMRPVSSSALAMRVTSIAIDKDGKTSIVWDQSRGDVSKLPNALVGIPSALVKPNEALVRADTSYVFTSVVQQVLPDPIRFQHTLYLKPRSATAVTRTN